MERLIQEIFGEESNSSDVMFALRLRDELAKGREPVYQLCKADSISLSAAWIDISEEQYEDSAMYPEYARRVLYSRPFVAAPADPDRDCVLSNDDYHEAEIIDMGKRLFAAVDAMCAQAGTETDETVDWLCGEHGGMAKLFLKYFSTTSIGAPADAVEKDAERYRYVCKPGDNPKPYICRFEGSSDFGDYVVWYNHDKAEIDAAIDAAIAASKEK